MVALAWVQSLLPTKLAESFFHFPYTALYTIDRKTGVEDRCKVEIER